MLKQVADFITSALNLSKRSDDHDRRLAAAEEKIEWLTRTVGLLLAEPQHSREHGQDEREKQELRFQLALERPERRLALPPAPPSSPVLG